MTSNPLLRAGAIGLLIALAVVLGCSSGPRYHTVRGTVTLDGEPIAEGDVVFTPEGGVIGPTHGKIQAGQYEAKAAEGMNKVEISASKIRPGGARGAGGEPVAEEYVPEEFNVKSKLTAEVKRGGANEFDFTLKTKK